MASVWKRSCDKNRRGAPWYCSYFDAQRGRWMTVKGYSDKAASEEKAIKLERDSARRAEGIIDPVEEECRKPIGEHIVDYLDKLRGEMCVERHVLQQDRRLNHLFKAMGVERIMDLTAARVLKYFAHYQITRTDDPERRTLSVATRNGIIASLKAFSRWAASCRRAPFDPLATLKKIDAKSQPRAHPRRALTPQEVGRLVDTALRRPVMEIRMIRTGKNRGKPLARVSEYAQHMAEELGKERRICYLIAVWAGLRRSEIGALRWKDLELDCPVPRICLRAEATKARRADMVTLHPQLAQELLDYRPAPYEPEDFVVSAVPDMNTMRRDLAMAGIDPGNRQRGFVDFHSLRMTLSTMMAVYGMSQRSRQAQMRHSDPRLTEITYMDIQLLPIADELARVPAIPLAEVWPTSDQDADGSSPGTSAAALPAGRNVGERGAGGVGDLAVGSVRRTQRRSA